MPGVRSKDPATTVGSSPFDAGNVLVKSTLAGGVGRGGCRVNNESRTSARPTLSNTGVGGLVGGAALHDAVMLSESVGIHSSTVLHDSVACDGRVLETNNIGEDDSFVRSVFGLLGRSATQKGEDIAPIRHQLLSSVAGPGKRVGVGNSMSAGGARREANGLRVSSCNLRWNRMNILGASTYLRYNMSPPFGKERAR